MPNIITQFTIQKVQKKEGEEKRPDRRITAKVGEDWVDVAAGWVKKDKNNNDYISAQMTKPFKDKKGFVIIAQDELEALYKECGRDWNHEHGK